MGLCNYFAGEGHYEGKCATCIYYMSADVNKGYKDGFYCEYRGKRLALDDTCNKYTKNKSAIGNVKKMYDALVKKYGKYEPKNYSIWHITTVICEKLGIQEYEPFLTAGEAFRKSFLEKDDRYNNMLNDYDLYGAIIAQYLDNEENIEVFNKLFNEFLYPFYMDVINFKLDDAYTKYISMYEYLKGKIINNRQYTDKFTINENKKNHM